MIFSSKSKKSVYEIQEEKWEAFQDLLLKRIQDESCGILDDLAELIYREGVAVRYNNIRFDADLRRAADGLCYANENMMNEDKERTEYLRLKRKFENGQEN